MNYTNVQSTSIKAVGYDAAKSILGVIFNHNSEYHYFDVPENHFKGLLSADSVGRYFDRYIKKGGYRYIQIK